MPIEEMFILPKDPEKRRIAKSALEIIEERGWGIYTSAELARVIGCRPEEVEEALGLCALKNGFPSVGRSTEGEDPPFRFVRLREGKLLWPSRRCLIGLLKMVPFRSY